MFILPKLNIIKPEELNGSSNIILATNLFTVGRAN